MNVLSIVFKNFWSVTFVSALLLLAQTHAGTLRRTLKSDVELTDTERIQEVIKDVILSSVKSEDGEVDPLKMESARGVGFKSEEEVKRLVDLAQEKGDVNEITDFLDSVYIIPKEATQYAFHHVEIIPKEGLDNKLTAESHSQDEQEDEEQISAPHALANAIESAINSEDGKVSPKALEVAIASGWTDEEVRQMASMALNTVGDHDGDTSRIQADLERLRSMGKKETPKKERKDLLPLKTWTA